MGKRAGVFVLARLACVVRAPLLQQLRRVRARHTATRLVSMNPDVTFAAFAASSFFRRDLRSGRSAASRRATAASARICAQPICGSPLMSVPPMGTILSTVSPLLNASPYVPSPILRHAAREKSGRKRLENAPRAPPPSAARRRALAALGQEPRERGVRRGARGDMRLRRAAFVRVFRRHIQRNLAQRRGDVLDALRRLGRPERDVVLRFGVRRNRGRRRLLFLRVLPPARLLVVVAQHELLLDVHREVPLGLLVDRLAGRERLRDRAEPLRGEREFGAGGGGRRRPGRRRRRGEDLLGGRRDARVFAEAHGSLRTRRVRVVARRRHSARRLLRDGRARALRLGREREPVHLGEELFLLFQLGAHRRGVVRAVAAARASRARGSCPAASSAPSSAQSRARRSRCRCRRRGPRSRHPSVHRAWPFPPTPRARAHASAWPPRAHPARSRGRPRRASPRDSPRLPCCAGAST